MNGDLAADLRAAAELARRAAAAPPPAAWLTTEAAAELAERLEGAAERVRDVRAFALEGTIQYAAMELAGAGPAVLEDARAHRALVALQRRAEFDGPGVEPVESCLGVVLQAFVDWATAAGETPDTPGRLPYTPVQDALQAFATASGIKLPDYAVRGVVRGRGVRGGGYPAPPVTNPGG